MTFSGDYEGEHGLKLDSEDAVTDAGSDLSCDDGPGTFPLGPNPKGPVHDAYCNNCKVSGIYMDHDHVIQRN